MVYIANALLHRMHPASREYVHFVVNVPLATDSKRLFPFVRAEIEYFYAYFNKTTPTWNKTQRQRERSQLWRVFPAKPALL